MKSKKRQLLDLIFPQETPQQTNAKNFLGVSASRMRQMRIDPKSLKRKHIQKIKTQLSTISELIKEIENEL
jgi:hypothetical protein